MHSKINYYLQKKKINSNNVLTAITNIISYSEIKIKNIKRRDYITKTLISFAKNYNYKKFGWIDYDKFKEKELEIIKGGTNINNFNTLNNILNNLNETVEDGESKLDKNNDIDLNPNIIKSDNNDINSVDENYDSGNNENIYKDEETKKIKEINDEYISKIEDYDNSSISSISEEELIKLKILLMIY